MALFRGIRTFTVFLKCIDATKRNFFNGPKYNLSLKQPKHLESSFIFSSIYFKPRSFAFKQNLYSTTSEKQEMKRSWKTIAFTAGVGLYGIYLLAIPKRDKNGQIIFDKYSQMSSPKKYILRAWNEINYYKKMILPPPRKKHLPDPLRYPCLQPKYTLVLELTNVLVHPDWTLKIGWRFKKRPEFDHFIELIAPPIFEIVIFTIEMEELLFPIVEALDSKGYIHYRLGRDSTRFVNGHRVKDLEMINRDLSKVIVIDWNKDSVKLHPRNTFILPRWSGNDDDETLLDLGAFLKSIASSEVEDVREVLDYYRNFDNPLQVFQENQRKLREQKEKTEKEKRAASSWTFNFFKRKFYKMIIVS